MNRDKEGFLGGSVVKNPPAKQETQAQSLGREYPLGQEYPLEKEMEYPLQNSCPENSMDRGAWRATVHWVAKESDTTYQLNKNKEG